MHSSRLVSFLLMLAATHALVAAPDTPPATRPAPATSELDALAAAFEAAVKTDFRVTGHHFEWSVPHQPLIIMHVELLREGYHIVHFDFDSPLPSPGTARIAHEFGFLVGRKGEPRYLRADNRVPGNLANVGDTLLLPFLVPPSDTPYAFSNLSTDPRHFQDTLKKTSEEGAAQVGGVVKSYIDATPNARPLVTNHAQPQLEVLGGSYLSLAHHAPGSATDSCTLLLQANSAGRVVLRSAFPEISETRPAQTVQDQTRIRPGLPVAFNVVARDQPVTILVPRFTEFGFGHGENEFQFATEGNLPRPVMLRVGDYVEYGAWSQLVMWDAQKERPHAQATPRITLENTFASPVPASQPQ